MQALIVHGADLSPHIGNANHFSIAGKVSRFVSGGQMSLRDNFDEGHSRFNDY
jgi:hypothetical protein